MSSNNVAAEASVGQFAGVGRAFMWCLKTAALWLAFVVGSMVAFKAVPVTGLPPALVDGPLTSGEAFLVVSGLTAVALGLVAAIARVSGWRLGLVLFIAFFAINSVMMQIETLWFNASLKLPLLTIGQLVADAAIIAAITALAGTILFHPKPSAALPVPATIGRRIAVMAVVYVVLYYGAGSLIAWQSAAVRAYYENGIHFQFVPTVLFQVVRGTLWALIALFILGRTRGPLLARALVMGVLFSVLTAAQLLYPTSFFTWAVRGAHLMEVGSSEFLYGVIATLVLLGGADKNPLPATSRWRRLIGPA